MQTIDQIASLIKQQPEPRKPVLIAIDGFGGSGKTTFAERLKSALDDAYVISIDDFIIKQNLMDISSDNTGYDRTRLEQQVLIPATTGHTIMYQRLEWIENRLSGPVEVLPTRYLIIEGISSCHPEIGKYYDYKIWVDTPIEVAKRRGKLRDVGNENEQHWELWAANDLAYQQKYHPEQQADFVVDGTLVDGAE